VSRALGRRLALAGLPALFVLHNDFWLWDDGRFVLGLPVGLTYHALFCLAATGVMVMLVRHAWPAHLEVEEKAARREARR
jgi:hypothetical protein